ncbi:uncharacterized protein METZ01_LOCUS102232 [marine metagenome]|uniref:Uncharacterized protein n=1 Tax=marine metagenome TaxID=408172 RepID=A0A381WBI7_9ZZZZ
MNHVIRCSLESTNIVRKSSEKIGLVAPRNADKTTMADTRICQCPGSHCQTIAHRAITVVIPMICLKDPRPAMKRITHGARLHEYAVIVVDA